MYPLRAAAFGMALASQHEGMCHKKTATLLQGSLVLDSLKSEIKVFFFVAEFGSIREVCIFKDQKQIQTSVFFNSRESAAKSIADRFREKTPSAPTFLSGAESPPPAP